MVQGRSTGRTFNVEGIKLSLRPRSFDRPLVGEIANIGWPAALDMMVLNLGFMAVVGMLATLDELAVAAHSVGLRIQSLAFVPGFSISMASAPLIGQALGRGDVAGARAVTQETIKQCLVAMTVLGLVFVFFDQTMVLAFDIGAETVLFGYTTTWIQVLGYTMPIFGVHIAFVGTFHGSGSTWLALGLNTMSTLAIQIPAAYVLGIVYGLGPLGVWLCFPIGFAARASLEGWAVAGTKWTRTGVHV
jgi:Na+-driven multidrug efflux pump